MFTPKRNKLPVAITGMGCVTAAGSGIGPLWTAVRDRRSFIEDGFAYVGEATLNALPTEDGPFLPERHRIAGQLPTSRFLLLTLHALSQAMHHAGWEALNADDGIILGTTTGNILLWETGVMALARGEVTAARLSESFAHEPLGLSLDTLCECIGFNGRAQLVSSACSSSTQALALGALWVASGRVKRCLVGGAEVLCRLTTQGFQSLQLLSKRPATPFDESRAGINLAEAAGFLCLEPHTPGKHALGIVSGAGFSSDAHHLTSPHPEGRGCYEAMANALAAAELRPSDISWVHAHGTGSPANDLAEGLALQRLFGDPADTSKSVPFVSSTKGIHGHTLAASGVVEAMLCLSAMSESLIPETSGLVAPDPRIRVRHPGKNLSHPIRHLLKNSLGFGGSNAAIILSHPRAVEVGA